MTGADQGKQYASDGRTDDFRQVMRGRVQRQRADDSLLRDKRNDQYLLRCCADGADNGHKDDQNHDVPELDPTGKDQESKNYSLQEIQGSAQNQELEPIHAVSNDAADRPEYKARCELKKTDEPEIKSGLGQFPNQPILDYEMYVLARLAREIAGGEETKLAVTQGRRQSHRDGLVLSMSAGSGFKRGLSV